jgi:hypothetical protein
MLHVWAKNNQKRSGTQNMRCICIEAMFVPLLPSGLMQVQGFGAGLRDNLVDFSA